MALKQIDHGTELYWKMVALRDQILRQPLGLSFTKEELEKEKDEILLALIEDEEILGCCMLINEIPEQLRLRQMAVRKNLQGKGIGESVMFFAEKIARDKGFKKMTMHARDTAVGFYDKFGYKIVGEGFEEVGIPHHVMEKFL